MCGDGFKGRRRHELIGHAIAFALLVALAGFALVLILLPGITVNALRGRYQATPDHILRSSLLDWQTWVIGLPISAFIFEALKLFGVFDG